MAGTSSYTSKSSSGQSGKRTDTDDMKRNTSAHSIGGPAEVVVYRSSTLMDDAESPGHTPKGKHSHASVRSLLTPRRALALAFMLTALALAVLATIPFELVSRIAFPMRHKPLAILICRAFSAAGARSSASVNISTSFLSTRKRLDRGLAGYEQHARACVYAHLSHASRFPRASTLPLSPWCSTRRWHSPCRRSRASPSSSTPAAQARECASSPPPSPTGSCAWRRAHLRVVTPLCPVPPRQPRHL